MVPDFASSWRLLFSFGAVLNISFILRAQSEFGLGPSTPWDGLGGGDDLF